jgi:hypothetical protein
LWADFAVGAVDFESGFRGCCSLPREVSFEDYGTVENISAEGQVQVFAVVGLESDGLHGWEFVDGRED